MKGFMQHPVNILRKQNVESLGKVGIKAISITAETATAENFQVSKRQFLKKTLNISLGNSGRTVSSDSHQYRDNIQSWWRI